MESQLAPGYLFQVYQLEHAHEKKKTLDLSNQIQLEKMIVSSVD